ncbi:replicative DNA helicase [Mycobacterium asiaticum]|uniref:Replicative DNA helicase n=1 Tax=Mycobacterium asiaticum TaxID=1790 RepID=A0A1A3NWY6_MYCAS|nr:replicative DNA helicase [Mycobacterium asiaticum]OBK25529.1 replicative DNA helicase [Mycobacterium asiaticum]
MAVVDDLPHPGMDSPPPSEDYGRQPPQDLAAEQSVLGGMLLSKDAIADVLERLRPGDFYRPAHQNVYDAILDLYGRGEPADAVTVAAELDRRGLLRRIGGAPYLHTLISTVPTAANAGYYATIVAEKALLRRLVEAGTRVVQYGYAGADGADVAEIVDRAQAEIYEVAERRTSEDFVPLEDLLQPTMDEIDAIASNGGISRGVPTGFTELDEVTNGLHPGQMIIVAARPGVGKALALNTPLPTSYGWTTMGDVAVGDWLLDAEGIPTQVMAATEVMLGRPCYEIEFSDGTAIVADANHLWPTGWGIRTSAQLRSGMDTIAPAGSFGQGVAVLAPVLQIVSVRRVPSVPVRCVEVDNDQHLYLAGEGMVPTHNSTLGLDFMRSCSIKHRMASVIFSLEMSKSEIVMRLLSAEAKIKLADMRSGRMTDDDWTRLARRMSEISEAPLYIDDSPNLTMMEIRAKARRLRQKANLKLVVVDYLQLMTSGKKVESRQIEVSEFSRHLKLLAKELEVPVVAISQLNRGPEQRTDKKPMLSDLRESGCLTAATRILRADTGAEVTFGELMRTGERPLVWSLDEQLRMVARPMTNVFPSGRKEVFRLRLASGREVEATGNHPFMKLEGWTPLEQLKIGDRIAAPRRVPEPVDTQRLEESEVILLAHMIGDGSCVKRQPIRYASVGEANLLAVTSAMRFGVTAVRDEYPAARVATLRMPAPYRLARGRRNPIAAWLDGLGLFGKRSHEKFVPAAVFRAPNDQVALFLRHLWATDGSVRWDGKVGEGRIYYATTSRRLADDVTHLLLRVGVFARIKLAKKLGYRDSWHVHIYGAENQLRFLRHVGVHGTKSAPAQEVVSHLEQLVRNPNLDTVPQDVWVQVRDALSRKRLTHRQFAAAMGTQFCGSTMWKRAPSRSRLHRAAAVLEDRDVHKLATSDVYWDTVVEISSLGEDDVYDGTVSGTHNFVANGIGVHNSLEQDADMVILLNRPDAFERDDPRGGEADFILAKHRNGPTKTVTVAHQLHLSRFANMAR